MVRFIGLVILFVFSLQNATAFAATSDSVYAKGVNTDNFLYLDTKYGRTVIVLYPKKAPLHVARVQKLVREGFYDGLKFHRVIHDFMAQTGDPNGDGTGGSKYTDLRAEFNKIPFNRGVIGAARTSNPNSANSQFFICFQAVPHLNGQYTVWGKVIHGMEFIDKLRRGVGGGGLVKDPDVIKSMKLVSQVPGDPPLPLQRFVPGQEKAPHKKILPRIN